MKQINSYYSNFKSLVNDTCSLLNDFEKSIFYKLKSDQNILDDVYCLVDSLKTNISKKDLKDILSVMKTFFETFNPYNYIEEDSDWNWNFLKNRNIKEYSIEFRRNLCEEDIKLFLKEHQSFFDKFTFCKYIVCFHADYEIDYVDYVDFLESDEVLCDNDIHINNYKVLIPIHLKYYIVRNIYTFLYDVGCIKQGIKNIFTKIDRQISSINDIETILYKLIKPIQNAGVSDDILYYVVLDHLFEEHLLYTYSKMK